MLVGISSGEQAGPILTNAGVEFEMLTQTIADHTLEDIFGYVNTDAGSPKTWTDGFFTSKLREMSKAEGNCVLVVVLGEMDCEKTSGFLENLNTLNDDNKKLCLVSGEIIPLKPNDKIVFVTESCANFSPASVSRLGAVFAA